ncbi:MAG: hypothetical protein ABIO39_00545 [Caulobacteraceae bacterium]
MTNFVIVIAALLATVPLTIWGVRFAKRHRRLAFGAATLLLLFGVNAKMDPPPPPRIEAEEHEEEAAPDDEPK